MTAFIEILFCENCISHFFVSLKYLMMINNRKGAILYNKIWKTYSILKIVYYYYCYYSLYILKIYDLFLSNNLAQIDDSSLVVHTKLFFLNFDIKQNKFSYLSLQ